MDEGRASEAGLLGVLVSVVEVPGCCGGNVDGPAPPTRGCNGVMGREERVCCNGNSSSILFSVQVLERMQEVYW